MKKFWNLFKSDKRAGKVCEAKKSRVLLIILQPQSIIYDPFAFTQQLFEISWQFYYLTALIFILFYFVALWAGKTSAKTLRINFAGGVSEWERGENMPEAAASLKISRGEILICQSKSGALALTLSRCFWLAHPGQEMRSVYGTSCN